MKKVFLLAGEVSGDTIAGWYLKKRKAAEALQVEGIGGNAAVAAGMQIYETFDGLNVVGLLEVARHAPRLLKKIKQVASYILQNNFDEVVLVDFPGFNVRLAKVLKTKKPLLHITYVSPPQLWVWGGWRLKNLAALCDDIIVMYPFEVGWYAARGVTVRWEGNPVAEQIANVFVPGPKKQLVALLPASRRSELATLFPIFLQAMQRIVQHHPACQFILPVPQSLTEQEYRAVAQRHGLLNLCDRITFITDAQEKYTALPQACVALTKPGTVTLELALLQVPMVIAFKTSWLSYTLASFLVRVRFMGLPNLLSDKQLCPELIQKKCTVDAIVHQLEEVLNWHQHDHVHYAKILQQYADFSKTFGL